MPQVSAKNDQYYKTTAHKILEIETEDTGENNSAVVQQLNIILNTLADEVRPMLAGEISETKAIKVLKKINEILINKFNYKYDKVFWLKDALKSTDPVFILKADCNILSYIYYSVLKDILKQNVVIVGRQNHAHLRWKLQNKYINWEATIGEIHSDIYYKKWIKSDYSLELDDNGVLAESYNRRGFFKDEQGKYEEAIKNYNKAIELSPGYLEPYDNRSNSNSNLKNYVEAIKDSDKAVALDPKYSEAYLNRGRAKSGLGDYAGAIKDYNKAIKLNPKYEKAYYNRANAKIKLEDFKSAIKDYDESIKLDPKYIKAYFNRAITKSNLGDQEGKLEDLRKAAELGDSEASTLLKDIKTK